MENERLKVPNKRRNKKHVQSKLHGDPSGSLSIMYVQVCAI